MQTLNPDEIMEAYVMAIIEIGERQIFSQDIDCVHMGVCAEIIIFMKTGEAHRLQCDNEKGQQENWEIIKGVFEQNAYVGCADTLFRPEAIASVAPLTLDGELYTNVLLRSGRSIRRRYDDALALQEDLEEFTNTLAEVQNMRSTVYVAPTLN